jgi:small subunit ribosomal protein S2
MQMHITLENLIKHNAHLGHHSSKMSRDMSSYIIGRRNGFDILDLNQTIVNLRRVCLFLYELSSRRGNILFVSLRNEDSDTIKSAASSCSQPYIVKQWVPGFFTNWSHFETIKKSRNYADEEYKLGKRTRNTLAGLSKLESLPDAIILTGVNSAQTLMKESLSMGIPVIGIADSNTKSRNLSITIPGNDDSPETVKLFLDILANAIRKGSVRNANSLNENLFISK